MAPERCHTKPDAHLWWWPRSQSPEHQVPTASPHGHGGDMLQHTCYFLGLGQSMHRLAQFILDVFNLRRFREWGPP
eukprot:6279398-Amphidinium_carterae.1